MKKRVAFACKGTAALLGAALMVAVVGGCEHRPTAIYNPALAKSFFPLEPSSVWTYRVQSKSQHETYIVTDRVVGLKYVPSLNVTGQLVEEYYNMDRGGSRPIVYVENSGFLSRLSGMQFGQGDIEIAPWGRSEDREFMPARMAPNIHWDSTIFPFGHMADAFDIRQSHVTVFDPDDVVVPAGRYSGCIRIDTHARYEGGQYAKTAKPADLLYRDWYAPNVGLVKTEVLEGDENGTRMELVELVKYIKAANVAVNN
ncbi:MAG TPA: hypothetical protein VFB15_14130 [Candidatus Binataceae bacterium]|nr:hypothetical protein [Candidatus Binataceae bacterium]